jgi:hypothetical protein
MNRFMRSCRACVTHPDEAVDIRMLYLPLSLPPSPTSGIPVPVACAVKVIASIEDPAVINQIFGTQQMWVRGRNQSRALNDSPDCAVIWLQTRWK